MTSFTSSRRLGSRMFIWLASLVILGIPVGAHSQEARADWQRGTILTGFAGGGTTASDTKGVAGTALGWEAAPHLTVEGRAMWFGHGSGSTDFTAMLNAIVPMRPGKGVVPFGHGGVGMYRADVDSAADAPEFYRSRMAENPSGVFSDFMLTFGGGVELFASSHIAVRPEVNILYVIAGSDRRTTAVYGVNFTYHFEAHVRE